MDLLMPLALCCLLALAVAAASNGSEEEEDEEPEVQELPVSLRGVAGGRVLLPCNLSSPYLDDETVLVLWYKDESASPLYSLDARRRKGAPHPIRHSVALSVKGRAHLEGGSLVLERLLEKDEGRYRCRVDFRLARTKNSDVILSVLVPPQTPIITDQNGEILQSLIGPYNEGDKLLLSCEAEGGKPLPSVTWWRESLLTDDSWEVSSQYGSVVRNELILPVLRRQDLMTVLTCQASNNNISVPVSASVTVDINFRPTEVRIEGERSAMSSGRPTDLRCRALGSRPPAVISWWKGSQKMRRTTDSVTGDGYVTSSVVTFTPSSDDSGKFLSCRAENPLIPGSAIENGFKMDVHYVPQLSLRLGSKLNHAQIQEGHDVYFECNIRSNPWPSEIGWRLDGREILTDVQKGVIVSNQSLVLQKVHREDRGYYTCVATNTEGQGESNALYLRVQHVPSCRPGQKSTYGVARQESVRVVCEVDADPPQATFRWEFNNTLETSPLLTFLSDGTQSVATYTPLNPERDYGALLCWSDNAVGPQPEPCLFAIVPAGPPDPPGNCSLANVTETLLCLECLEGYDGGLPQFFVMEVHQSGQHLVMANVTSTDSPLQLWAKDLPSGTPFVLVVYAANVKGRSRALVLTASTLAAPVRHTQGETLWQFDLRLIPIVLTGVVLVLILLAVLVVAAMKDKARKEKKTVEVALSYEDLTKKQPSPAKECSAKVFAYSLAEEMCPDIIPAEAVLRSGTGEWSFPPGCVRFTPKTVRLQSLANSEALSPEVRACHSTEFPGSREVEMTSLGGREEPRPLLGRGPCPHQPHPRPCRECDDVRAVTSMATTVTSSQDNTQTAV